MKKSRFLSAGGSHRKICSRVFFTLLGFSLMTGFFGLGCSLFSTRPVQEMSDTVAALKAAKEVQADTLAPELYRQAGEWFFKAKREYKFKNFKIAREYAGKARRLAEQAEFESVRSGGTREDIAPRENLPPAPKGKPYNYPKPEGTPADVYDQRKGEEDSKRQEQQRNPTSTTPPTAPPAPPPQR